MNTLSLTTKLQEPQLPDAKTAAEVLEDIWFDEAPQSQGPRSSAPPVSVGGFLGDELADSWLR